MIRISITWFRPNFIYFLFIFSKLHHDCLTIINLQSNSDNTHRILAYIFVLETFWNELITRFAPRISIRAKGGRSRRNKGCESFLPRSINGAVIRECINNFGIINSRIIPRERSWPATLPAALPRKQAYVSVYFACTKTQPIKIEQNNNLDGRINFSFLPRQNRFDLSDSLNTFYKEINPTLIKL